MNFQLFGLVELALGSLCFFIVFGLAIITTVFWIWMLVDCLINESSHGNNKLIWCLVIFFLHSVGALLYLIIRRPERKRELGR